ncbi:MULTISPECIES: tetratricopeptide repeat-containing diguanylate cyclase [unclassified Janthinobacterium]|uniref:tetratricopeptide repeat-containing diguanylate cyclase n=1 Tax=unclassified Janthinobacterium TaxID=2610881 RepID=UPI0012F86EAB|nr:MULTISPECIES: GGDEF domain-containing protein [unclassified Janthinobacterium]
MSSFPVRRASSLARAALLAATLWAPVARADDAATLAQLRAIVDLSYNTNVAAFKRLQSLRAALPAKVSYRVQRELLLTRHALQRDAGQADDAFDTLEALRELAQANGDQGTLAMARLGRIDRLLHQNKPLLALAALDAMRPHIGANPDPQLQNWLDLSYGDAYNATTQYDKALSRYLAVLRRAEGSGEATLRSRLQAVMLISRLYVNMSNPEKGLEMATSALDAYRGAIAARPLAWLLFAQGIAYVALDRNAEGLAAFELALATAERAGLVAMEGTILGNIANHYLRAHQYMKAEVAARKALAKSLQVGDASSTLMAKANLGFALGGQGKVDAALPYIHEVIASLRASNASGDLVSMLDETSRMLEGAGRPREALTFVREQQHVQKGLLAAERDQAVAALQEKFEADRRQRQIGQLARDNLLKDAVISNKRQEQWVIGIAAALLLVAGVFVYLQYRRATSANAELERLNTQLEFHATRDPLTGLFNRRVFLERMQRRAGLPEAERRQQRGSGIDAITIIDIDHFKQINDRWGHAVGDRTLVEVARRLTEAVRSSDIVLRWGGEEFLVFAPGMPPNQIEAMVERLLHSVGTAPVDCGDVQVPVKISAGTVPMPFCDLPEAHFGWEKAVQLADMALYYAKSQGRNRAVIASSLREPAGELLARAESDFAGAVAQGIVATVAVAGPQ